MKTDEWTRRVGGGSDDVVHETRQDRGRERQRRTGAVGNELAGRESWSAPRASGDTEHNAQARSNDLLRARQKESTGRRSAANMKYSPRSVPGCRSVGKSIAKAIRRTARPTSLNGARFCPRSEIRRSMLPRPVIIQSRSYFAAPDDSTLSWIARISVHWASMKL